MDAWGAGGRTAAGSRGVLCPVGAGGWSGAGHCRVMVQLQRGGRDKTGKSALLLAGLGAPGLTRCWGRLSGRDPKAVRGQAGCPREVSWAERGEDLWGRARLGALKVATSPCAAGQRALYPQWLVLPGVSRGKAGSFLCDFSEEEHST